jgi:hypothetical protein
VIIYVFFSYAWAIYLFIRGTNFVIRSLSLPLSTLRSFELMRIRQQNDELRPASARLPTCLKRTDGFLGPNSKAILNHTCFSMFS